MKIAIYGSRRQQPYARQLLSLIRRMVLCGYIVVMHRKLYSHLLDLGVRLEGVVVANDEFPQDADMALSIGGDGTFLRTAAWTGMAQVPILGVNTGHLGYLAGVSLEQLADDMDTYLVESPAYTERTLIEVSGTQMPSWCYALNEVAISKDETASMIVAKTAINGSPLADYKADGLIVSTPTGSTAYNLSVGGPIVEPSAPVWVISPIAAHSLSMRPMVVNDASVIDIVVEGRSHSFRLSIDGRSVSRPVGSSLRLRRAGFVTRIVKTPDGEFPEPLRRKLMFN